MIMALGNYSEGCLSTHSPDPSGALPSWRIALFSLQGIQIVHEANFYSDCTDAGAPAPLPPADHPHTTTMCKSQEGKLALLWTAGIFAINSGPVLVGFILDYLGPKFTAIFGMCLNMLGLILFALSSTSGIDAFVAAAVILGLGNVTFHLAQFHVSALFPKNRRLVSTTLVAGSTASGIIMYLLKLIFEGAGSTPGAYRGVMISYAGVCALWIPMLAWIMPNDCSGEGRMALQPGTVIEVPDYTGLLGRAPDRPHPMSGASDAAEEQKKKHQQQQEQKHWGGQALVQDSGMLGGSGSGSSSVHHAQASPTAAGWTFIDAEDTASTGNPRPRTASARIAPLKTASQRIGAPGMGDGDPEATPLLRPREVSGGPVVFEARRFVEIRRKTFMEQLFSVEFGAMGVFYTLNIFFLQFYLGTQRLQLEYKGDYHNWYANAGNCLMVYAFIAIPIIRCLLDEKGYDWTLGSINALAVTASTLQAIPRLWTQVTTLTIWVIALFFAHSSHFEVLGGFFGCKNFGRLVAWHAALNGLFALLQYPLTHFAIDHLDGNFTWIHVAQVILLLPLFVVCYFIGRWEREDLVPICRPLESEELPTTPVGPRTRKRAAASHCNATLAGAAGQNKAVRA